jgi:outer membrane protein assembly factor BamB
MLVASLLFFVAFGALTAVELAIDRDAFKGNQTALDELRGAKLGDEGRMTATSWPQWRGLRRDGVAHCPNLRTPWPDDGLPVLWTVKDAGAGYSSFAVAAGRVYTMLREGDQEVVVCWKADRGPSPEGAALWRRAYPCPKPPTDHGSGPRATPTYDDGRLYTVGVTGLFHCLNAETGEVLWKHDLQAEFRGQMPQWGYAFSPLVEGDLVYTIPGGPDGTSVAAFDKRSGKLRWKAMDDPPGYSSPVAFTVAGQRQIVCFTGKAVAGLSPEGKVLWRVPFETAYDVNAATPLAFTIKVDAEERGCVFVTSGYNRGCMLLSVARGKDGGWTAETQYESKRLRCHFSSPVRLGDLVFGFNEATLTCLDVRSGEVKWRKGGFLKGSLILIDDYLLVQGEDGRLALGKASAKAFAPIALAQPMEVERCWTLPALADGLLYVRGGTKDKTTILCLDLRKRS